MKRLFLCAVLWVGGCTAGDVQSDSADVTVSVTGCSPGSNEVTIKRGMVRLTYDLRHGTATFAYDGQEKVRNFYAGVELSTYVTSTSYSAHSCQTSGDQTVITSTGNGHPTMQQFFIANGTHHVLTRVTVEGTGLASNWMGPIIVDGSGSVNIGATGDPRLLWVPFDNDDWVRYRAAPLDGSDTSYEVGAFFENTSRRGIVVGSVTHDMWKTGVYYQASSGKLDKLNVFGGATWTYGAAMDAHTTHDVVAHGKVTGSTLYSPIVFLGFSDDWRNLMEEYADANAAYVSRLPWSGGVPFGWNSWGGFHDKGAPKLTKNLAIQNAKFLHDQLEPRGFKDQSTAYANLDANWSNLSDTDLQAFASSVLADGQHVGMYFSPFVAWPWDIGKTIPGSSYTYDEAILLDNDGHRISPKDGAFALDPTHPATHAIIDYNIGKFLALGATYVKVDFLTFGAVDAKSHYDPSVQTGIEAYNAGMKYLLGKTAGKMFVSESIGPLFPYNYAHARRVSCDTFGAPVGLESSEYELESTAYGWWMSGRLYDYSDPDAVSLYDYAHDKPYGAAANKMRVLSAAVTGTVFLSGDDLSRSDVQALALDALTHDRVNSVARLGKSFRPVEGVRDTSAPEMLVMQDGAMTYLAVFNYTGGSASHSVDLARIGLDGSHTYHVTNLWDGNKHDAKGHDDVSLGAFGSTLLAFE